jgi:hypothetical protein
MKGKIHRMKQLLNKTARAKAEDLLAGLERINSAIAAADAERVEAEVAAITAETRLGEMEAAQALGEIPEVPPAAAKAIQSARTKIESIRSRREALIARRRRAEDDLAGLEAALAEESAAAINAETEAWYTAFYAAAENLRSVMITGLAIEAACDRDSLHFSLYEASLPDPRSQAESNLLSVRPIRRVDDTLKGVVTRSAWRDDPAATRLHDRLRTELATFRAVREAARKRSQDSKQEVSQ